MKRVFIIAEAGVNHSGSLEIAKKLVEVAVDAGVDAVKFQTFKASGLVSRTARKAAYQEETTGAHESQFDMLRKLELDSEAHRVLHKACGHVGIEFLSTPFDSESVELLVSLGMQTFKIPSGEITNLPHLRHIGRLGKRVILSTGMSELKEVADALAALVAAGTPKENITVLHTTTEYPAPLDEVNLRAMRTIGTAFGVAFGYSDHTPGIEVPIAAAAMGASIIEKHFTLDRNLPGPDHRASLEPHELKAMVKGIRNVTKALGDGIKRPAPGELKNMAVARKSIVAARAIRKGEYFSEVNLTCKRPGTGISPMRWDEVIGKPSPADFMEDEPVVL